MNRKITIAVAALLLAIVIGGVVWTNRPEPPVTGAALPTFDYAAPDSWALKPSPRPPAVWEGVWDIDVVLLASEAAMVANDRIALETRRDDAAETLRDLAAVFEPAGPVYAPYLRAANPDADISAAVLTYLAADNRGRAFVVATDAPLPADVIAAIEADPLLRDRFAGVLFFGERGETGAQAPMVCSRRYKPEDGCVVDVDLRRNGGRISLASDGPVGGRLIDGFIPWLNERASKLAEPLGELEEVEIVEIRRPGETDDALDAEEN
ncbi:hypothetical protein [Hyphomonas sp.]|uniref:hypothetical protein n=1 Tax=Hyphomonas sp. TaxID=87 RepID=UPI003918E3D1